MTSIRCPICKAVVSGDGETVLTHSLRDHLADTHEMRDLCETRAVEPPPTMPTISAESGRTAEEERKIVEGKAPPEMQVRERREESILCPFCGSRLFGRNGDELSTNLQDHVEDVHDLKATWGLRAKLRY